jgi:multicomponent Na+:H+ antiporter subunit E
VILNGKITLEICIFGVIISACTTWFSTKMLGYDIRREFRYYRFFGYYIVYALIVIREIFKANFAVIKLVFDFGCKPQPVLVSFTTDLKSEFARVALANSITLTPGTISVELDGDKYAVHCLDERFVCDFNKSCFAEYLRKIESRVEKLSGKTKGAEKRDDAIGRVKADDGTEEKNER